MVKNATTQEGLKAFSTLLMANSAGGVGAVTPSTLDAVFNTPGIGKLLLDYASGKVCDGGIMLAAALGFKLYEQILLGANNGVIGSTGVIC